MKEKILNYTQVNELAVTNAFFSKTEKYYITIKNEENIFQIGCFML